MTDFFGLFTKVQQKVESSQYQFAKIGIVDDNGNITTQAVGRPDNYIYVRMLTGQDVGSVAVVRNRGVAPVYDTTVRIRLDPVNNNEWVTHDVDPKFELANPTSSPANVPFHRHYIGSGLDDPVELRRFIPCRVWSSSGLTVNIDKFPYQWNGVNYNFPGITNLDVSSHVPSSGLQRFIVVGVDPTTNTETIIDGSTYSSASVPLYANLLAISTGSIITSGGIALINGQTVITEASIYDMRPLLSAVSSGVVVDLSVVDPIINTGTPTAPIIGFAIKYNYTALRDPISDDDQSQDYSVGSQWINNDTKVFFVCVQSTVGMAIWEEVRTSSSDIASLNVVLSTDVSMPSASTYYDSVTIGLTAGTWLITGGVTCSNALPTTFSAKLWDGIDIFDFGASNSIITKISFSTIVTPRSTTDYKISVSADVTNSTILHANNQTQLSAIRLSIASGSLSGSPIGMLLGITKE